MAKIIMAFQVIPCVEEERIYEVVDRAIEVVAKSNLKYEVGAMETTIEGEPDEIWKVIRAAQEACIQAGATRVMTQMKMDYVPEGSSIEEKIKKYRRS